MSLFLSFFQAFQSLFEQHCKGCSCTWNRIVAYLFKPLTLCPISLFPGCLILIYFAIMRNNRFISYKSVIQTYIGKFFFLSVANWQRRHNCIPGRQQTHNNRVLKNEDITQGCQIKHVSLSLDWKNSSAQPSFS